MNLNETFALTVRLTRKKRNISQEKLAELSGLHRTYISLVERGKRNITLSNIEKIARALETKACILLDEEYIKHEKSK